MMGDCLVPASLRLRQEGCRYGVGNSSGESYNTACRVHSTPLGKEQSFYQDLNGASDPNPPRDRYRSTLYNTSAQWWRRQR